MRKAERTHTVKRAQIPALFIAICAGIIVTRVQTGDAGPSNVGRDIGAQVLSQPRALIIAAAVALGMGLIPGMPKLTFICLAAVIGVTAPADLDGRCLDLGGTCPNASPPP